MHDLVDQAFKLPVVVIFLVIWNGGNMLFCVRLVLNIYLIRLFGDTEVMLMQYYEV